MKRLVLGLIVVCFVLAGATAWGANVVDPGGFSRIDTFGSDVVLGTSRAVVKQMYITSYDSAKTVTFINQSGAKVLVLEVPTGSTVKVEDITFPEGLIFDDSASDLAAGDLVFVWMR